MEGKFIVIEGPDGSGKSTQVQMLVRHLRDKGLTVVAVREPGGTEVGERVRSILRDRTLSGMSVAAEVFLYMASRAQLVSEVIAPALEQGQVVIADRYLLSSVVYQGAAGGLGADTVRRMGEIATGRLAPALTLVIDVDEKKWLRRKGLERDGAQINIFDEPPDREELKGVEFHRNVRRAYLEIAGKDGSMVVINGGGTPEQVHEQVVKAVENALR